LQQANETLLEYQHRLKSLVSELTLTEERLKRTVATELHDDISQSLAMLNVKIRTLEESVTDPGVKNTLAEISEILSQTLLEAGTLTYRLSYPALNVLGLEKAINKWLTEEIQDKNGIETRFESDGAKKYLNEDIQAVLFRGVREVLTNAVKHAHASYITVSIKECNHDLQITVHDNGVGCHNVQMIYQSSGFGLLSVQEALEKLGGQLSIDSGPDQGCTVTLTAPLNPEVSRELMGSNKS
jgi:signal transduction histidine kinase